jgi:hypothetical protein
VICPEANPKCGQRLRKIQPLPVAITTYIDGYRHNYWHKITGINKITGIKLPA